MKRFFPLLLIIALIGGCLWAQSETPEIRAALNGLIQKAESGDAKALYDLARLYDTGYDSIPVDSLKSTALYLESAQKGYSPARNYIGFRYFKGEIVNRDVDSALYWIRAAANDGDITAATNLGYLYLHSDEVNHDENEAAKWLMIAAEEGVIDAQNELLNLKSAEWDTIPADSAFSLGVKYYIGKAPIIGVKLIEIASREHNPRALALLGDAYSKGRGVAYDHKKSMDYFFQSAQQGYAPAQFIIAELLDILPDSLELLLSPENSGNKTDDASFGDIYSAQFWYEKAAEGGINNSDDAFNNLLALP